MQVCFTINMGKELECKEKSVKMGGLIMNEKLFLGVKKTVVTPKVGCRLFGYGDDLYSELVNDDLDATVFVFEQGAISCVMVSITVVSLTDELSDRIRKGISEKTGIPVSNIMLAATHTHSGPATIAMDSGWGDVDHEYCDSILVPRIIEAATIAASNKQEVKVC